MEEIVEDITVPTSLSLVLWRMSIKITNNNSVPLQVTLLRWYGRALSFSGLEKQEADLEKFWLWLTTDPLET